MNYKKTPRGRGIPAGAPYGDANYQKGEPLEAELFPEEIAALKELKECCPETKHYNDRIVMIFLFARKLDVKRTKKLIENNWKWRQENDLETLPQYETLTDDPGLWSSGIGIPAARSKEGHFMVFLKPGKMDPKTLTVESLNRFMAYYYLHALQYERMDGFRNGFYFVEDFSGYSWKNFDMKIQKALVAILQDKFPITYKKILVIHPPAIFRALIAISRLFTKKKLIDRIKSVKPEELSEYIDEDDIPISFGGKRDWDGKKFHEYVRRWDCQYRGIEYKVKDLDHLYSQEHVVEEKEDFDASQYKVTCVYCNQQINSIDMEEHVIKCEKDHPRSFEDLD